MQMGRALMNISYWPILHRPFPIPDSKVHGANMGPIWGRQDPSGPMLAPLTLLSGMLRNETTLALPYLF